MGEGWDGGGKKRLTSIFLLQPAIEGYYTVETRGPLLPISLIPFQMEQIRCFSLPPLLSFPGRPKRSRRALEYLMADRFGRIPCFFLPLYVSSSSSTLLSTGCQARIGKERGKNTPYTNRAFGSGVSPRSNRGENGGLLMRPHITQAIQGGEWWKRVVGNENEREDRGGIPISGELPSRPTRTGRDRTCADRDLARHRAWDWIRLCNLVKIDHVQKGGRISLERRLGERRKGNGAEVPVILRAARMARGGN